MQEHIVQHPTHAQERHARVKAEEQARNKSLSNNVRISIRLGPFLTFGTGTEVGCEQDQAGTRRRIKSS
jgi:hypothetical protein